MIDPLSGLTNDRVKSIENSINSFIKNLELALNNTTSSTSGLKEIDMAISKFAFGEKSSILQENFWFHEIKNINDHLCFINKKLEKTNDTLYVGIVETLDDWKEKRTILKIPFISFIFRALFFLFYRVLPKLKWYQIITFYQTKRLLSKAEILGRFVYNGFEIGGLIKLKSNYHVFVMKRIGEPLKQKTSEGIILKINRIGKNGKLFKVYKLRTMHPYSEYLHEYMITKHGFNEKGKIKNDFRAARWAKVFRKYWLDELPQLLNVLKFEMKLVGIRPVSESYFDSLPIEIQEKRIHHKPGCIPPYVAHDFGTTKESVLEAELVYMEQKTKNPYSTDIKYFFVAIFNIIFRGKRSS
jgi:lipopolysaccharide/colanic/teichoic acid biosynthesis glycosyltransferase